MAILLEEELTRGQEAANHVHRLVDSPSPVCFHHPPLFGLSLVLPFNMMDTSCEALVSVIRSCRAVYDQEHQYLSQAQRDNGWAHYWASINTQLSNHHFTLPQQSGSSIPQKRSASSAMAVGMEPAPTRARHVCTSVVLLVPSLV